MGSTWRHVSGDRRPGDALIEVGANTALFEVAMRIIDLFPEALDREEDLLIAELEGDPGCPCPECKEGEKE